MGSSRLKRLKKKEKHCGSVLATENEMELVSG